MNSPSPPRSNDPIHVPVLLDVALFLLASHDGGAYVDGTFGAGGYTRAILDAAECSVLAIDRDPDAVARGQKMVGDYPGRLNVVRGRFGDLAELVDDNSVDGSSIDGVALDLGVSSPQLDEDQRGFSFRANGPLDMRMEQDGPSAADLVNTADESDLADIIHNFGEERRARRVARAIIHARNTAPIETTAQLANIVRRVVPKSRDGIDPATRTFQGLRIHVNDELGELRRGLAAAETVLRPGGRLIVVSFHSLEDRCVKTFLRDRSGGAPRGSRHMPDTGETQAPSFKLLSRSGITPDADELRRNPRARSARLRAAERTSAPVHSDPKSKLGVAA
jgi:16S rRNA (cytosine1402-N4)-methyltransferase